MVTENYVVTSINNRCIGLKNFIMKFISIVKIDMEMTALEMTFKIHKGHVNIFQVHSEYITHFYNREKNRHNFSSLLCNFFLYHLFHFNARKYLQNVFDNFSL